MICNEIIFMHWVVSLVGDRNSANFGKMSKKRGDIVQCWVSKIKITQKQMPNFSDTNHFCIFSLFQILWGSIPIPFAN